MGSETQGKYNHKLKVHNLKAPKEIVPEIIKIFNPKSVIDVGCGLGTFLFYFKKEGVNDILGVDGKWVDKKKLYQYIEKEEFMERDLENEFRLERTYDVVLSLEVAEHLSPKTSITFIRNLVSLGNIIIFSAAIPFQGGQNHLNEQWLTYWEALFRNEGFVLHDILRPMFWHNKNINWWYRQNIVVFAKAGVDMPVTKGDLKNLVHPELLIAKSRKFEELAEKFNSLSRGEFSSWFYVKLLIKSFYN